MPLLDHFHPPLSDELGWDSLHSGWATRLADDLNDEWLTSDYRAVEHAHLGPRVEIEVTTLERSAERERAAGNGGGVATPPRTWSPPVATCTVAATFPDRFEVCVYEGRGGWYLVGAVETTSSCRSTSSRPTRRRAAAAA
jgi:hypothetical protein